MEYFHESDLSEYHIFEESTLIRNISIDSLDYGFINIPLEIPLIIENTNNNMDIPVLTRVTQSIPYIMTHGIDSYIEDYFSNSSKSEKEELYNKFIQDENKLKAHINYLTIFK